MKIDTELIQEIVDKVYPIKQIGDCTFINITVAKFLKDLGINTEAIGGNFVLDEWYYDEGIRVKSISHSWLKIKGKICDFALSMFEDRLDDIYDIQPKKYKGRYNHNFDFFIDEKLYKELLNRKEEIISLALV